MTEPVIATLTDYLLADMTLTESARLCAHVSVFDSLGCAVAALTDDACRQRLKAVANIYGQSSNQSSVSCTGLPVLTAQSQQLWVWQLAALIRWQDYSDTWLAAEWGHPSDNIPAVMAAALLTDPGMSLTQWCVWLAKAYEIQGLLALDNSLNQSGLDHTGFVKVASAGVCAAIMGGDRAAVSSALSHAFADLCSLRVYRHKPAAMARKSWAAADASTRGCFLAQLALAGEPAIEPCLELDMWGYESVALASRALKLSRKPKDYVLSNVLYKVSFPAEFHAQTACELAIEMHRDLLDARDVVRAVGSLAVEDIASVVIHTTESSARIIDRTGPLENPAARDHCLQYMVAVGLLYGEISSKSYSDDFHCTRPEIDALREKMQVVVDAQMSRDYLNLDRRSIGNRLVVTLASGGCFQRSLAYPLGHSRRRQEALPMIRHKLVANCQGDASGGFDEAQVLAMFDLGLTNPETQAKGSLMHLASVLSWCE